MSQYTHIFLEKQHTFIEVSCTSRNCALSEMFQDYAPWEKIREVTYDDLQHIYDRYKGELSDWNQHRKDLEERIKVIATFNNTIDEKLDAWRDIDESLNETKETIEELESALNTVVLLKDVLYESQISSKYESTAPVHVYAGTECGSDVTVKDIEGYTEMDLKPVDADVNMFDGDQCWDQATKV